MRFARRFAALLNATVVVVGLVLLAVANGAARERSNGTAPPRFGRDGGLSMAREPLKRSPSIPAGAVDGERHARSRLSGACPTYITITQHPASPDTMPTASITVQYGETNKPQCVHGDGPTPSSFQFTVNGQNRTSFFSVGASQATASALPLIFGTTDTLRATIVGYDSTATTITNVDTTSVIVPTYAVQVTPVGPPARLPIENDDQLNFLVHNGSSVSVAYSFSCTATGPLSCLSVTPTSATLGVGKDTMVAVLAAASSTTGAATIRLGASGYANAAATVSITVFGPPRISLAYTPASRVERGECPVVGTGPESMVECGSLVFAHSFPGYRVMGRARGITLLYNSATVHPMPPVVIDYTTFGGQPLTQALRAVVFRSSNGVRITDTTYFSGSGFTNSFTVIHRLVLAVNADSVGLGTGVHPIKVYVQRKEGGTWQAADTASTRLIVVNRERSPFGAGWWPAGVEKLITAQDACGGVLLVSADGSGTYFSRDCNGIFTSPPGERSKMYEVSGTSFKRVLPGNRVTVWYDANGLVQRITDNNPRPDTATYAWRTVGPDGPTILSITDPVGKTIAFDSDASGVVYRINIPGLNEVRLNMSGPDGNNATKLLSIKDADSLLTPFTYDAAKYWMLTSTSRRSKQIRYTYDATTGTLDTAFAPNGIGPTKRFRAWQLTGAPAPGTGKLESTPATPAIPDTVRFYASWPRSSVRDTVWFAVGTTGAPTQVKKPGVPAMTTIDRDSIGQPLHIITPLGAEVWQVWNADGTLAKSIAKALGGWSNPNLIRYDTTAYTYDTTWKAVTLVMPPNHKDSVTVTYDAYGRQSTVTDALGRTTQFFVSNRGLADSIVDPHPSQVGQREAVPTKYTYDPVTLNVLTVRDSAGLVTYAYDAANGTDLIRVTDALSNYTTYSYDGMKRTKTVTRVPLVSSGLQAGAHAQPPQSTVTYQYNDTLLTTTIIDPLNKSATTTYDAAGRPVQRCVRPSWCESFQYNDGINPTIITLRSGKHILQTFDGAGRLVLKTIGEGAPPYYQPDDTIAFNYDIEGHPTSIVNRYAKIVRNYDAFGRVILESEAIRGWNDSATYHAVEARYDYDRMGRRSQTFLGSDFTWTRVCSPVPGQYTCFQPVVPVFKDSVRYHYTSVGTLDTLVNTYWQLTSGSGPRSWSYTYDRKNRLTDLTAPTTTAGTNDQSFAYDNDDRLVQQNNGSLGRPSETLVRDVVGRAITDNTWRVDQYTYNGLGQLTDRNSNVGTVTNESFSYDANGNRVSDLQWGTYSYNDNGQLTSRTGNGCSMNYHYDANGNETGSGWSGSQCSNVTTDTAGFDVGDHMRWRNVMNAGHLETRSFWYDGLGRRVLMKSDSTGPGNSPGDAGLWRYWWLDDNQAVKTYNLPWDPTLYDSSWPTLYRDAAHALQADGEWLFTGPGTDNTLGSFNCHCSTARQRHLFFRDWRGSVNSITNETGQDQNMASPSYEAFGTADSPPSGSNPGYNGQESSGGLVYMRNRWYDPNTGRFTQQDPIGYAGGSNLYAFGGADPVTYSDPYGLLEDKERGPGPSGGPPPVPVPGGGPDSKWQWNPDSNNPRGGTWGPDKPIPGRSQPTGSWEPADGRGGKAHWDVDDGKGTRTRVDEAGTPISDNEAHGTSRPPKPNSIDLAPADVTSVAPPHPAVVTELGLMLIVAAFFVRFAPK